MPRVYHDPEFAFRDRGRLSGAVDLQIFRRDDDQIVAIVSELIRADGTGANAGVSATDGIEEIATLIFSRLGFDFDYLIEHYPQHGRTLDLARSSERRHEMHEQFHLITLMWDHAAGRYRVNQSDDAWAWKHISRADVEALIGEPFQLNTSSDTGTP